MIAVTTADEFNRFVAQAPPGARCCYFIGHFARDLEREKPPGPVTALWSAVQEARCEKKVHLTQARKGVNEWLYIATRALTPAGTAPSFKQAARQHRGHAP